MNTPLNKYQPLVNNYSQVFPGYNITAPWLSYLAANGINVGDPNAIAELLKRDVQHYMHLSDRYQKELAGQPNAELITPEWLMDLSTHGAPIDNVEFIKEKAVNLKNQGVGGGSNPQKAIPTPEFQAKGRAAFATQPNPGSVSTGNWTKDLTSGYRQGWEYANQVTPRMELKKSWQEEVDPNGNVRSYEKSEWVPVTRNPQDKEWINEWGQHHPGFARSVVFDRAPEPYYRGLTNQGKIGYLAGRAVADVTGHGSKKFLWHVHPLEIAWGAGADAAHKAGMGKGVARVGGFLAAEALGIGSGNYNPLNVMEGGRTEGYQAISPDPEDPRKSTNPVVDLVLHRGLLGRTGKLLPWDQYHAERPEVPYQEYAEYRDYLTNKDPGLVGKATLGLVKAKADTPDGPDVRILGYHMSPLGIAATVGTAAILGHPQVAKGIQNNIANLNRWLQ